MIIIQYQIAAQSWSTLIHSSEIFRTILSDAVISDAEFTRTEAKSWFDTDNWCVSDSLGKGCVNDTFELLDTEKVPCKYDNIVFPPGNTYYVDLQEGVDVFMNSLELSGEVCMLFIFCVFELFFSSLFLP